MRGKGPLSGRDVATIPQRLAYEYAAADADAGMRVLEELWPKLEQEGLRQYFLRTSTPINRLLVRSSLIGMRVDRARMNALAEKFHKITGQLETTVDKLAGRHVNLKAPYDKSEALFKDAQVPIRLGEDSRGRPLEVPMTDSGFRTTDRRVLEDLFEKYRHPMLAACLDHSRAQMLRSHWAPGMQKWLDDQGRVHTRFQVAAQRAGRISSQEPPLCTMPRDKEYSFLGETEEISLRDMFIAGEGNEFTDADVKQAELVAVALVAGDTELLQVFKRREDVHNEVAWSCVEGTTRGEPPTKQQRALAKNIEFGVFLYGGTTAGIAAYTGQDEALITSAVEKLRERFPITARFLAQIGELALSDGYLQSPFKRKRRFVGIDYRDEAALNHMRREAQNFLPQTIAAEVVIATFIRICRRFRTYQMTAWPTLIVYDDIVVEHPRRERRQVREIMIEEMLRPVPELDGYRFATDVGTAERLGEAQRAGEPVWP